MLINNTNNTINTNITRPLERVEFDGHRIDAIFIIEYTTPMQYAVLTIEYILKRYGVSGERLNGLSKQHIRMAIMSSGYVQSELVLIDLD